MLTGLTLHTWPFPSHEALVPPRNWFDFPGVFLLLPPWRTSLYIVSPLSSSVFTQLITLLALSLKTEAKHKKTSKMLPPQYLPMELVRSAYKHAVMFLILSGKKKKESSWLHFLFSDCLTSAPFESKTAYQISLHSLFPLALFLLSWRHPHHVSISNTPAKRFLSASPMISCCLEWRTIPISHFTFNSWQHLTHLVNFSFLKLGLWGAVLSVPLLAH